MSINLAPKRFIYRLVNPVCNLTFYVGATLNTRKRMWRHEWEAKNRQRCPFHYYLLGLIHSQIKPIVEVLEETSGDDWIEAEQHWIKHFKELGHPLLNLSAGGYPATDPVPESRARMSMSHRGTPQSAESNKKRAQTQTGEGNHFYGRRHSLESRALISAAKQGLPSPKRGVPQPDSVVAKRRKTYIVTSPDGTEITVDNLPGFCQKYGLNRGNMATVAAGRLKHSQGWKCRHAD